MDWLGLSDITPDHVYDLVRAIDSDGDGFVSSQDFKEAFHLATGNGQPEQLQGGGGLAAALRGGASQQQQLMGLSLGRASMRNLTIPPKLIPELADMGRDGDGSQARAGGAAEAMNVTLKNIKGIKIKVQHQERLVAVWDSRSVGSRGQVMHLVIRPR